VPLWRRSEIQFYETEGSLNRKVGMDFFFVHSVTLAWSGGGMKPDRIKSAGMSQQRIIVVHFSRFGEKQL